MPALAEWMSQARLDVPSGMVARVLQQADPHKLALLERVRGARRAGLARLQQLLETAAVEEGAVAETAVAA